MSSTTVAEFANELKKSADVLLQQLSAAGVAKASDSETLSDADKQKLLSYLQTSHGTQAGDRKKITLVKKSTSEIKQADATGKWTWTPSAALADGSYSYTANQTDTLAKVATGLAQAIQSVGTFTATATIDDIPAGAKVLVLGSGFGSGGEVRHLGALIERRGSRLGSGVLRRLRTGLHHFSRRRFDIRA